MPDAPFSVAPQFLIVSVEIKVSFLGADCVLDLPLDEVTDPFCGNRNRRVFGLRRFGEVDS